MPATDGGCLCGTWEGVTELLSLLAAAQSAAGQTPSTAGGVLAALMPFLIMLVVFYFFLIRPQQKQQKQREEMLQSIKKGDKVITVGGIHGEVVEAKGDVLTLRIADKVEVKINRSGIGQIKGK